MARIALIAGMAVLGAAVSVMTGGLGAFAVGAWAADIMAGVTVGAAAGSTLASVIFPPSGAITPQLNDRQIMSSAPGMPIPWGYGSYRISGNVIWAAPILEQTQQQSSGGGKGGPTSTTYIYSVSAAISFGYGPGNITRIWADAALIYDVTSTTPIAIDTGWTHNNGQQITSPFEPVIYPGSATQNADPTVQAALGASATPAFRDQIYMVINNFPLADYGNRLPNFRAEVSVGATLSYVKDMFPPNGVVDPLYGAIYAPSWVFADPLYRVGYSFDLKGGVVQKIDFNVTTEQPLDGWTASTTEKIGNQILDSNGNVQCVTSISGDGQTGGGLAPTWYTGEGDTTNDNHVVWQNMGPGPNAVTVISTQAINIPSDVNVLAPNSYTVDTAGYIWVNCRGTYNYMLKLDSSTFSVVKQVNYNSITGYGHLWDGVTAVKSSVTGKNYLYCICNSGSRIFGVIDADAGAVLASGTFLAPGQDGSYNLGTPLPCIDPATGNCYVMMWTHNGANNVYTTHINLIQPLSGIVQVQEVGSIVDNTTTAVTPAAASACYWCAQDKTLLLQTNNISTNGSSLWKVNPSNAAVLDQLNGLTVANGDASEVDPLMQAYSALTPSSGVIKLMNTSADGTYNWVYINVATLTIEQTVSLGNWLTGGSSTAPLSAAYDALSDAMLMTFATGAYANLSVRIFFDREAVGASLLSDVITDVWTKSGGDANLLDVSRLTGTQVSGYPITSVSNGKGIMQPLCTAYFFDMVESDNLFVAVPRGQSVSTVIPETDLGLISDQYKAQPTVMQENDLPKSITIVYYDQTLDYQQGKQMFQRNARVKKTKNQTNISLPLTLQPDDAAAIAYKALATAWQERNQWEFKLWRLSYLVLDPTDVIQFTYNGQPYTARVSKHQIGQNLTLVITASSENSAQYINNSTGAGIDGFVTGSIQPVGPTLLLALDIPFVQDTDAVASGFEGYYWAAGSPSGGKWPGGQLFVSPDNQTWAGQGTDTSGATYGVVVPATPAPSTFFAWDYVNTITVRIVEGALASNTALNVLNGTNWFYLGGEIMAFQNATLNADGSYTLDTLLRGLRGTEGWCGTHVTGETFVVLDGSVQHQIISSSYIGVLQYLRGITIGQPISAGTSQTLQLQGNDLKPYAPAQFTGSVDGSSNIVASWARRTRIGGAWLDGTGTVPLSEETESYDLAIYDSTGTTLKRLVSGLTSPSFTYTAAMQTTDFGSTQASVYAIVWQNSAVVGHGFPATNPTLGAGNVISGGSDATSILGVTITGTPADGDIMQYNSGANAWEIVGPMLKRQSVSKVTGSLSAGAAETGTWSSVACKTFAIMDVLVSATARVTLYSTAAFRDADNGRAFGAPPAAGIQNGIIADFNLDTADPSTGIVALVCSNMMLGANMDTPNPANQIYYRVTNLSGSPAAITATLTILPLEVQ